ncbi:MAG: HlyD family efflux transporter periplasmic adaptor subunit [Variovorax sp.]|nr:MAG: HlyD family efflux transporter periplasmic adaptor subunit [Variovorax sp.]
MPAAAAPAAGAAPPPWPQLREELQLHEAGRNRDGSPAWHIADPVRNQFVRIGWLEFEMLRRWPLGDAEAIANDIAAHTPLAPEPEDVQRFAHFLEQQQLARGAQAAARPAKAGWQWLLDNYLFIRIPLVRPQRWLERALPHLAWLFSRGFLALTGLAGITGLVLAARQWDRVEAQFAGAMSWEGVAGFALALIGSKLIHELGHALASVRHGVRVGHMGVALLVMWPMPYTDTGESWKLGDPRHRFAIASAGIASELVLAAWCTLLWNLTPDGDLRNSLFFLATTAWVLTLAVNASPFMRFDGYFMLSDAIDYPGLHERAGRWAKRFMRHALLGIEDPPPEAATPDMRRFLVGFALATWVYRLVLFLGIALLVYHAFFKALGVVLFVVEIMVFIVRPVMREVKVWWQRRAEARRGRLLLWMLLLGGTALVLAVPWSSGIGAAGVLRAGAEQPLYSPYAAQLQRLAVADGTRVRRGDVLAELSEPTQASERAKARALESAYESAARGALADETLGAARLAMAEQQVSRYGAERVARDAELARLQLTAQHDGVIRDVDRALFPGAWVGASRPIAWLVDTRRFRVEALVSERDALRLKAGDAAQVHIAGAGPFAAALPGRISAIDNSPVQKLPHLLLAREHGGPIALNPGTPPAQLKPAESLYRVLVEGDTPAGVEVAALRRVHVRFEGEARSLAKQWAQAALSVVIQQADF